MWRDRVELIADMTTMSAIHYQDCQLPNCTRNWVLKVWWASQHLQWSNTVLTVFITYLSIGDIATQHFIVVQTRNIMIKNDAMSWSLVLINSLGVKCVHATVVPEEFKYIGLHILGPYYYWYVWLWKDASRVLVPHFVVIKEALTSSAIARSMIRDSSELKVYNKCLSNQNKHRCPCQPLVYQQIWALKIK